MFVTGWDSLALQGATIEWWGDGTNMALVVMEGIYPLGENFHCAGTDQLKNFLSIW